MSVDGIFADVNSLAQTAPQYHAVADQMMSVLGQLAQTLQNETGAIGADDSGRQIAAKFGPAQDAFWQNASVAAQEALPLLGDTVGGWAQAYGQALEADLTGAMRYSDGVNGAGGTGLS